MDTVQRSWPPREGMQFYLLWMAGIVLELILIRTVSFTNRAATLPGTGVPVRVLFAFFAIAVAFWHAWLLFKPGWRFLAWGLSPLIAYVVYFSNSGMLPLSLENYFQAA